MSLVDFTTDGPISVHTSDVESERFGYDFGRCTIPIPSTAETSDIACAIEGNDADITVLRYAAEKVAWFDELSRLLKGHRLIYADSLIYWELVVGDGRSPETAYDVRIGPGVNAEEIGGLAAAIFAGYSGHYQANPLLSAAAAEAGYEDWAMRTPLDDTLVMNRAGSPIGLATTDPATSHIEILLAGIIPSAQGRGYYSHLLRAVELRALDASLPSVVISTQAHNTRVQRAWARYGFATLAALTTVHVVRDDVWRSGHS